MPRLKVRSFLWTLLWALLCFALVTLLLSQVLPSTTAIIKVDNDVYVPARPAGASRADSRPEPDAQPAPPRTTTRADRFTDLHGTPTKLSYPNADRAKVDMLNLHSQAEESWQLFQNHISKKSLYDPADPAIGRLLADLERLAIVEVEEPDSGTQLKLFVTLENGGRVMYKPMRFDREHARMNPNQFYFSDFERHNAEIASYHLDRVLGFNRVPPTIGRVLNITRDIERFADKKLKRTIFISPAGNKCFHGNCDYYCDTGHAICGKPDMVEGSFQALFPLKEDVHRHNNRSPWRRSYSKHRKAAWETDPYYCEEIEPVYRESRFLLDVMDVATFDFLQGNQDRHHLDTFAVFANESFPILFDNGRAFGRADFDDVSILAPVAQCCMYRYSTLKRLLQLQAGPKRLSAAFTESSRRDPVFPLLADDFVEALDRRLAIVLDTVRKCVSTNSFENVIFDDGL